MLAETPFSAIPQIQLEPQVSQSEPAVPKHLVRMIPGSSRNWIAVNAVQQFSLKKKQNMTTLRLIKSMGRKQNHIHRKKGENTFMNSLLTSLSARLLANAFGVALAKADHQLVAPKPSEGGSLFTIRRPRLRAALRRLSGKRSELFIIVFGLINLALFGQVRAVSLSDTFYGLSAGNNTTTGVSDSAFGFRALFNVTTGSDNTATGAGALESNTTGASNTANGAVALNSNTTGSANTASGYSALNSNTTGNYNTAAGRGALQQNTLGDSNTATNTNALSNNTTGGYNTATGDSALAFNTTGSYNIATGPGALR